MKMLNMPIRKIFATLNLITSFVCFPVGVNYSFFLISFIIVGDIIFGEATDFKMIMIPLFLRIIFISMRISLCFDKLYKKKFIRLLTKIYLVADTLFCVAALVYFFIRDISLDSNGLLIVYGIISILGFLGMGVLAYCFFRNKHSDKRGSLLKKIFIVYLVLIPLSAIINYLTVFYFSVFVGAFENLLWLFILYQEFHQEQAGDLLSDCDSNTN